MRRDRVRKYCVKPLAGSVVSWIRCERVKKQNVAITAHATSGTEQVYCVSRGIRLRLGDLFETRYRGAAKVCQVNLLVAVTVSIVTVLACSFSQNTVIQDEVTVRNERDDRCIS